MPVNRDLLAPCGCYCGVCAVYYATRDDNLKLKELLVGVYQKPLLQGKKITPEQISCRGCLSGHTWGFCADCRIRSCAQGRGLAGCHQCESFPCQLIQDFPIAVGQRVMLRNIPRWAEVGDEQWAAEEEARYGCPGCGSRLFRGAKRCHKCGLEVDLD